MVKTKTGRSRASPDVRARILEAADRLFYAQGFHVTGVNQIIEEARVAKASFYTNFPAKEALGVAYLTHRHERWFAELRATADVCRAPRRRAVAPFTFLARWLPKVNFRGCAFLNLLGETPLPGPIAGQILVHKEELRGFFRASVVPLCASKATAKLLGEHLLLLFEGAIIESQIHRDLWPVATAAKVARQAVTGAG